MAGGLQELRRRIRSAQNTQQITRAMKMVAGAKLRRAEERARQSREYMDEIRALTQRASRGSGEHPLLVHRPVERFGMVVVSSDRGLAGPYNANVLRQAMVQINRSDAREKGTFVVGRKGREYLRHRSVPILDEFIGLGDEPSYRQAKAIADTVIGRFLAGEVDRVDLTFTRYVNPMSQHAETLQLLPVPKPELQTDSATRGYLFEPDAVSVLAELLPRYVEVQLYGALLEAKASEQGARMTAMDSASKNAEELIRRMILMRNRLRQAAITREIAELVGGAEALE